VLVLSRGVDPNHPELILTAIAGGGIAAALALLALTFDETDEAFANVYSGAVSTQNLLPRVPQRALIVGASVLATAGALAIDMRSYQRFLLLLGAVFVPLLGVLLADWLLKGAHYTRADVFEVEVGAGAEPAGCPFTAMVNEGATAVPAAVVWTSEAEARVDTASAVISPPNNEMPVA